MHLKMKTILKMLRIVKSVTSLTRDLMKRKLCYPKSHLNLNLVE